MATKLLIVDDSLTIRTAIKLHLQQAYEYAEAESAERGLRLARLLRPAVAIVDVNLPGMDGVAFAQAMRADTDPSVRGTGLLLITGDLSDDLRTKALEAGADAFIRKPLNPTELRDAVAALVARRQP